MLVVEPAATVAVSGVLVGPPIWSPLLKISRYEVVHSQVPSFFTDQVLVKGVPAVTSSPSETVTSATKVITSQPPVAAPPVVKPIVAVASGVAVTSGVLVANGVLVTLG